MKRIRSGEQNMDNLCVEVIFDDGSKLAVDTNAVEQMYVDNQDQRAELDWLIYNKPPEYIDLVLSGEIESYIKTCGYHSKIED